MWLAIEGGVEVGEERFETIGDGDVRTVKDLVEGEPFEVVDVFVG